MPGLARETQELFGSWLVHGSDMPTPPADVTIQLYATAPGDNIGDGDDGYHASTPKTLSTSGDWNVLSESSGHYYAENGVRIAFGEGDAGWTDIVAMALWDGPPGDSTSTALWYHEFDQPLSKGTGSGIIFEPGELLATIGELQDTEPGE